MTLKSRLIGLVAALMLIATTLVSIAQDAKPDTPPQASAQDRAALDFQLCNFQLNGLKEGLLQAQAENKALKEEIAKLKGETAKK